MCEAWDIYKLAIYNQKNVCWDLRSKILSDIYNTSFLKFEIVVLLFVPLDWSWLLDYLPLFFFLLQETTFKILLGDVSLCLCYLTMGWTPAFSVKVLILTVRPPENSQESTFDFEFLYYLFSIMLFYAVKCILFPLLLFKFNASEIHKLCIFFLLIVNSFLLLSSILFWMY